MENNNNNTTVDTVDMDLDQLLNIGDAVMLPSSGDDKVKNSIFSRNKTDLSFLDKPEEKEITPPADNADKKEGGEPKVIAPEITSDEFNDLVNDTEVDIKKTTGRPKLEKEGLIELTTKLFEKNLLTPFDDEKPLDKYTLQDFEELIEANFNEKEKNLSNQVSEQFFNSLPGEFQYAAEYISKGGTDLKGLFKSLAQVEEVRQMNPADENDARHIVRSYLQATNFGNQEEIEEEIVGWDDRGELENKAAKFKPKLDAMSEKQVQYKLQQQAQLQQQQQKQMELYMDNVYKTLEPGELNGLRLDRKTQNLLFTGLVQPNYQSANGNATNLLGHLLEKHQYIEPNHGLIAEALWLLADPDGYKNKVREITKKEVVADTVRKLKSEQSNKSASYSDDEAEDNKPKGSYKIPRAAGGGFFKR